MKYAARAWMPALISIAGACAGTSEEIPRPDEQAISSRVSRGSAGELVIAVTHSGGGAGDTIHRLLACPSSAGSCESLASVDTNDRPPPALVADDSKIAFVINESDYLGDFRNYSRLLPDLQPGSILIRYRNSVSPLG